LSGLPPLPALDYSALDMQLETELLSVTLPDIRGRGWQRAVAQATLDGMEGIVRDRVKSGDVVYDG
jgi:hypothetical protein